MALNRTIGVVQMDCELGETKANLDTIEAYATMAGKLGIELLIFPEAATTGYFLGSRLGDLAEPAHGPVPNGSAASRTRPGSIWLSAPSPSATTASTTPSCCSGRTAS